MNETNYLSSGDKKALFEVHSPKKQSTDTGAVESQVALFSARIVHLTQHLKTHKKRPRHQAEPAALGRKTTTPAQLPQPL